MLKDSKEPPQFLSTKFTTTETAVYFPKATFMEKCVPNVQKWLFRNLEIKRQQSATREMDAFLFVAFKTYLFQRGGSDNSDILLVLFPLQSAAFQAHSI